MEKVKFDVLARTDFGKQNTKKIRQSGRIPCVVYGKSGHKSLTLDATDLEHFFVNRVTLGNLIFSLNFENAKEERACVIQEIQKHPLTEKVLHIDFKEISMKETIITKILIVTKGTPVGVQLGGIIEQHLWNISISCLPQNMPDSFKVDISHLKIGDFLHVSDLAKEENFEVIQKPEDLILAVVEQKAVEEEEGAVSDEEPSEGKKEPEVTRQKSEKDDAEG